MSAVLRWAGRVATGAVPAALLVRLGLPALGAVVLLAVLVLGTACWVIGSKDRTERVSRVLLAWRGNPDCLAHDNAIPSAVTAARPGRRLQRGTRDW